MFPSDMLPDPPSTAIKTNPDGTKRFQLDPTKGRVDRIKDNMYKFYKTPDGEDCLVKTYYYTKYSAIAGAIFSVYEMGLISRPQTFPAVVARFGRFTLPFAGMGLAFGTSLCLLGKIRQKTDVANHVVAGAAAGAVWGVKYNSVSKGHMCAVVFGLLCGYFRYFYLHNLPTFVVGRPEERMNYPVLDFSIKLYDDPGRPSDP